jgi:hypothetical protein
MSTCPYPVGDDWHMPKANDVTQGYSASVAHLIPNAATLAQIPGVQAATRLMSGPWVGGKKKTQRRRRRNNRSRKGRSRRRRL